MRRLMNENKALDVKDATREVTENLRAGNVAFVAVFVLNSGVSFSPFLTDFLYFLLIHVVRLFYQETKKKL